MKCSKTAITLVLVTLTLSACATQRYGRETELSDTERTEFSCKEIKIESAKSQKFLDSIREQRRGVSGAHVLGALADFGVGNMMEGDAAEESGEARLKELRSLAVEKHCKF
ncbi:MAG: hypothetical protein ACKVOE_03950 [Rickettsiales bacterium]